MIGKTICKHLPNAIGLAIALGLISAQGAAAQVRSESTYENIGGVSVDTIQAKGFGQSPREAVLDALQNAVSQYQGLEIGFASAGLQVNAGAFSSNGDATYYSGGAFANAVVTASEGTIKSYRVVSLNEAISPMDILTNTDKPPKWVATVSADFQSFRQAANAGLPRIIIAPLQTSATSFQLADTRLSRNEVEQMVVSELRSRISETNAFILLDREKTELIDSEITFVTSGRVNKTELSRIGQMYAADLILIPTLSRMAYNKSVRSLNTSDRQLVSYSGGMDLTIEVINIASGVVEENETYSVNFPSTEPTTLSRGLDGRPAAVRALKKSVDDFFESFVSETSPITILQLNGPMAVLNAGDSRLEPGKAFDVFMLGDEMFDPQTHISLGRAEFPVGSLKVTRVTEKLSYGALALDQGFSASDFEPASLILRSKD